MQILVTKYDRENERYHVLQKKYIRLNFNTLAEAMNNRDFYFWVQRLKKHNKNYVR